MRKMLLLMSLSAIMGAAQAQTLFTYGSKPVSKEEFIQAFNKNPAPDTTDRKTALKNYLDLYIKYKLKVQDAYDEKLNNNDQYRNESDNFKKQLADAAVNNEANLNSLVDEAYQRGQKDLNLSQIFIPATTDTAAAYKRINTIYTALKNGKVWTTAVDTVKETPVGYITAFTLPYEVENMVYALKPGGFTAPYHSSVGYHIFILKDERPAVGRRLIEQILFAVPPGSSDADKAAVAHTADSVYQLIQNGASFTTLQSQFNSLQNGKTDMEVSVGQYSPGFEKEIYALQKEGDVSKPFETDYGYNIIKLIQKMPAVIDPNDLTSKGVLQQKVEEDERLELAKQKLVQRWKTLAGYKPATYDAATLWRYTDSAATGRPVTSFKTINRNTVLFSFAKQKVTVTDWLQYMPLQTDKVSYSEVMREFVNYATTNYYKNHIEDFNTAIKPQLDEFNNANLLFAAMDKHVWTKASQDSAGLLEYYNANKEKYKWAPGADAVVFSAGTRQIAEEVAAKIKANPADWHTIVDSYGSLVQADSSRFEKDQLPLKGEVELQQGYLSTPAQNDAQDGYTFVYITKVHNQPEPRSFEDARGLVINDYQQVVEAKWIDELRKKYPVIVNQQVFASIK